MSATVYLLSGSDPILRGEALDQLVAELVGDQDRTLTVEEFSVPGRAVAGEAESDAPSGAQGREELVAAALNAAQSPPFMSERRVVVLQDAGNLGAGDVAPLIGYLDHPLPTTALVVVAGGDRLPKSFADALKAAKAVRVGPPAEKTADVLAQHLADAGIGLRPAAAKLVAAHLGEDAGRVPQLVQLLASVAGPGATLDVADVEPYLGDAGPVPNYQLTSAIEAGDMAGALETLRRMLTAPGAGQSRPMHPLQVIGTLHSYYRRVATLDDPRVRSPRDAVVALDGRVKEYPARKALDQARALQSDGVRTAFDHLFAADLDIKGARAIPEDAVLEVLVARLAALSGRARTGPTRRSRSRTRN